MLVYTGRADGLVSGAAHSTADTVRPALQIIRTKPGVSKTSGAFIMMKGEEKTRLCGLCNYGCPDFARTCGNRC